MTMTLIQHQELASNQSSLTFSSIPQTFTDLYLVASLRSTSSADSYSYGFLRPNNDSSNTTVRILYGVSSGVGSASYSTGDFYYNNSVSTSNTFASLAWTLPNYTSSVAKSFSGDFVTENNSTGVIQVIEAGLYNSTSPITSLVLFAPVGNLAQYSSATLYGITKGSSNGVTVS